MEFHFSKSSKQFLETIDPRLALLLRRSLQLGLMDFTVTCGLRGKAEQDRLFKIGRTKLPWPKSKHNSVNGVSKAVDVAPFIKTSVSYNHTDCSFLAGIILSEAKRLGLKIRWGGNWDRDGEILTDQAFDDLVHFELED